MAGFFDKGGKPASFGEMLMGVGKNAVRLALSQVLTNTALLAHVASRMYSQETNEDWSKIGAADRALWMDRARNSIAALMEIAAASAR